ncbi:MAG: F0F1 ATP synthase subunit B [Amphiplicatus sp.]
MSLVAILVSAAEPVAAHAAEAGPGLPQMDASTYPSQLFWLAVTFGFLYWIMTSFVLPRLGGVIEERRDRIADDFDQAAEFKRKAEEAEAAYEAALADAKARARAIAAETRESLNEELAELQREADARVAASLAAAEARIAAMKEDAAAKVREAAAEVTRAIVEALIDETPTPEAVDSALNGVAKAA